MIKLVATLHLFYYCFLLNTTRRSKGDNLITSGPCLGPCAEGYKVTPNNVQIGEGFDWTNSGTSINGTAYAIKACLEDSKSNDQ